MRLIDTLGSSVQYFCHLHRKLQPSLPFDHKILQVINELGILVPIHRVIYLHTSHQYTPKYLREKLYLMLGNALKIKK